MAHGSPRHTSSTCLSPLGLPCKQQESIHALTGTSMFLRRLHLPIGSKQSTMIPTLDMMVCLKRVQVQSHVKPCDPQRSSGQVAVWVFNSFQSSRQGTHPWLRYSGPWRSTTIISSHSQSLMEVSWENQNHSCPYFPSSNTRQSVRKLFLSKGCCCPFS